MDGNGVQQVLTDFRSPLPSENPATDWTKPQYYSTIQAANVDGEPGDEIVARFADGLHVYKYIPPNGSTSINGGSWQQIAGGGPFGDAVGGNDPSIYSTIHLADLGLAVPVAFGRRSATTPDPSPISYSGLLNGQWEGTDHLESPLQQPLYTFDDQVCGIPACYLSIQGAKVAPDGTVPDFSTNPPGTLPGRPNQMLLHTAAGVSAYTFGTVGLGDGSGPPWFAIGPASTYPYGLGGALNGTPGPFADVPSADCPFSTAGASGPGSGDCLGTSPSYYETLRAANIDGRPGDELLARASDGLRVRRWNGGGWDSLATLSALAGAAGSISPGVWGSIRTGDINGDGKDEVLALDGTALQAWSYDPVANKWTKLPPSVPLSLAGDLWLSHPEYYSTIQVGDVDGDGHADVVARGPFGIRTWFYDRRGTGGWERYLPGGYPDFPSRQCPAGVTGPCGQQAAFTTLNNTAETHGANNSKNIRDKWTANTPDTTTLETLETNLAGSLVGNCSNETNLAPPTYASCVRPSTSSTFDASEWTAVVNEMLSEAFSAEQVVDQYNDLNTVRQAVFESESGSLPAIATDLQLAGAAGNSADFNLQGFFSGASGIAASIAGAEGGDPTVSAALWVISELFSMAPSDSATATSSFQTTYSGLLDKFATAQDEMRDALSSQQQQVLGDQGLLSLVGQLRWRGTWKLDINGMLSASREAFALQTYQALLPTMYQRYAITNCTNQSGTGWSLTCILPEGPYVIGNTDGKGTNGTWLTSDDNPCSTETNPKTGHKDTLCDYTGAPGTMVPDSVANIVWGSVSPSCNYSPKPLTLWHYGCSLGVPIATSIGADSPGWTFATLSGNPVVGDAGGARAAVSAKPGVVRADDTLAGSGARAARAGASARMPRETLGPLRFSGRVFVSTGLRLRRTRVVVERALFEYGRREELALSGAGRPLRPFALRHVLGGLFTSRGRGVQLRVNLRRLGVRGAARLDLRLTARTRDIRALCGVLPASVSLDGRPLELETRLRLRDRGLTGRIIMRQRWRCVRDRAGEFVGIEPVKPRPLAARPGLTVRMQAPLAQASARRASVLITVTNRRRPRPSRVVSSLWHLRITGSAGGLLRTIGLKELRAGRSRTMRLTLTVPTGARGPVCVRVVAAADSARPAGVRRCARAARSGHGA